jgi:purine-binding chemotaxis protein CheW
MPNSAKHIDDQVLLFILDEQSCALSLESVSKVIHAVEIRPLPKSPEIISGIINFSGRIIPVIDIRMRLGLKSHEIGTDDSLIIVNTSKRELAIIVDDVLGINTLESKNFSLVKDSLPLGEQLKGIVKSADGIVLIYDLELFLSTEEEIELDMHLTKNNEL